jgi:hypothetical protein
MLPHVCTLSLATAFLLIGAVEVIDHPHLTL